MEQQGQAEANAQVAETRRQETRAQAGVTAAAPGTPVHAAVPSTPQAPDPAVLKEMAAAARSGDTQAQQAYRRATVGTMLSQDPEYVRVMAKHNEEYGLS
jgi:hypothetical protein